MCVECVNHYKQPLKYMGDWYNFFKSVMQLITVLLWVGCILKCSITWRLNFITRANEWSSFFVANHKDIIYLVWRHKVTIFIIQGEDWKMYLLLVQKVTKPLFLFLAGFFAMMWTKRKGNTVLLLFQHDSINVHTIHGTPKLSVCNITCGDFLRCRFPMSWPCAWLFHLLTTVGSWKVKWC